MDVIKLQRLESAAIFITLILLYRELDFSWIWFLIFVLAPDLFMVGYLKNPKVGALVYNIGHSYFSPALLWFLSYYFKSDLLIAISIIWAVHIAMDRMLGIGLKLPTGFRDTHLGKI